jgi:hypothetical protein
MVLGVRLAVPSFVLVFALGCGRPFEVEGDISQAGGELIVRGEFGAGRGVVVLVDGVAASGAVFESHTCVRVRVPPLPRSGVVDVQLLFANDEHGEHGERVELGGALRVSAPPLEIRE